MTPRVPLKTNGLSLGESWNCFCSAGGNARKSTVICCRYSSSVLSVESSWTVVSAMSWAFLSVEGYLSMRTFLPASSWLLLMGNLTNSILGVVSRMLRK